MRKQVKNLCGPAAVTREDLCKTTGKKPRHHKRGLFSGKGKALEREARRLAMEVPVPRKMARAGNRAIPVRRSLQ